MSEARFDRIDQTLERMNQRFDSIDQRFGTMDRRFVAIDQRFGTMDRRFGTIDQRFDSMDQRIEDLDRHMHVLHEETMARIAAIPGYAGATKGDVAELRKETTERLEPLEAAVRHHSVEIERLKKGRG